MFACLSSSKNSHLVISHFTTAGGKRFCSAYSPSRRESFEFKVRALELDADPPSSPVIEPIARSPKFISLSQMDGDSFDAFRPSDDFISVSYGSGPTTPGEAPLADWALNGLQKVPGSTSCPSLQQDLPQIGFGYDFPFSDIDFELENPVGGDPDANLADPRSKSVDDFSLQRISTSDHRNLDPFDVPNSGISIEQDRYIGPHPLSESPQFEGLANSLSNAVPPDSISPKDAPQQPTQLPLTPAPNFRCPTCPRKFISKNRLE